MGFLCEYINPSYGKWNDLLGVARNANVSILSIARGIIFVDVSYFLLMDRICLIMTHSRCYSARYGDGAGNTVEENSSVFSLIRMR